jgi:uncharacterized membrane protein
MGEIIASVLRWVAGTFAFFATGFVVVCLVDPQNIDVAAAFQVITGTYTGAIFFWLVAHTTHNGEMSK